MEISTLEWFTLWFGLTEAIGALLLVLIAVWLGSYRGGFAWQSNPKLQFNWHPLLMTVSMIFMYGNAILIFRAFRNSRKRKLKIAHTTVQGLAFIFAVVGLQAAFDSHNLAKPPIPNMYSLHSWLGIAAVFLFSCQWVTGLITFLYPTLSAPLRACYYPVHIYFGMCAFICAAATALIGLTEKVIFSMVDYSNFSSEGLLINFIGVTIILFTGLVIHLVSETKYKRQPLPEDEMLLTSTEHREVPQRKQIMCFEKPDAHPVYTGADCHGDTMHHHLNPEDFQSCELVLECFGEDEETVKIRIDHLHIASKHH